MSVYNLERKEGPVTFDSAKPLVVEIGLGCYFWLALCTLLSGALYPALEVGTACQIPLTLSCDAGLLLGFAGCLAVAKRGGRAFGMPLLAGAGRTFAATMLPLLPAFTTSVAILLRTGMLFEEATVPMIAGDVLLGASLAAAGLPFPESRRTSRFFESCERCLGPVSPLLCLAWRRAAFCCSAPAWCRPSP